MTLSLSGLHNQHKEDLIMRTSINSDTGGVVISLLCVVHCLALPIIGLMLPVFGILSENEWVHKILVMLALPLFINLAFKSNKSYIILLAIFGIMLLFSGAFYEPFHEYETIITVMGSCALGAAHLQNLRFKRHAH